VQADSIETQRQLADENGKIAAVTTAELQAALLRQQHHLSANANIMARTEAALRSQAEGQPARVQELTASYMRIVLHVGRNADRLRIQDAGNIVRQETEAQNVPYLPEFARVAARHMVAVSSGNPPSREQAMADLTAVLQPAAPAQPSRR
jgi:hypothetical protein